MPCKPYSIIRSDSRNLHRRCKTSFKILQYITHKSWLHILKLFTPPAGSTPIRATPRLGQAIFMNDICLIKHCKPYSGGLRVGNTQLLDVYTPLPADSTRIRDVSPLGQVKQQSINYITINHIYTESIVGLGGATLTIPNSLKYIPHNSQSVYYV